MGKDHASLYDEVTARVIAQLEEGRLPWVQPWDSGRAGPSLPHNAGTARAYSGINILILWATAFEKGYAAQSWLTYRQAQALGGNVRRGEQGTTVCYADKFVPKGEEQRARDEDREARQRSFLKRFTVFNVDQCDGLPSEFAMSKKTIEIDDLVPRARHLIAATGARFHIGGAHAFYAPGPDVIHVPPPSAYHDRINWYRTVLHELGHWTGHPSRLARFKDFGDADTYGREELCAEMASAFLCAELGIVPTVRHADYIGAWLAVLQTDNRAVFRAASLASKAAAYILDFEGGSRGEGQP